MTLTLVFGWFTSEILEPNFINFLSRIYVLLKGRVHLQKFFSSRIIIILPPWSWSHRPEFKESGCCFVLSITINIMVNIIIIFTNTIWSSDDDDPGEKQMRGRGCASCLSCVRVTACASGASRCLDAERSTSRRRRYTSYLSKEYWWVTRGQLLVAKLRRGKQTVGELAESAVRGFWRWEAGLRGWEVARSGWFTRDFEEQGTNVNLDNGVEFSTRIVDWKNMDGNF